MYYLCMVSAQISTILRKIRYVGIRIGVIKHKLKEILRIIGEDHTESWVNSASSLYVLVMACLSDYAIKDGSIYLPSDSPLATPRIV